MILSQTLFSLPPQRWAQSLNFSLKPLPAIKPMGTPASRQLQMLAKLLSSSQSSVESLIYFTSHCFCRTTEFYVSHFAEENETIRCDSSQLILNICSCTGRAASGEKRGVSAFPKPSSPDLNQILYEADLRRTYFFPQSNIQTSRYLATLCADIHTRAGYTLPKGRNNLSEPLQKGAVMLSFATYFPIPVKTLVVGFATI